jgi:hypothetical protein
MTDDDIKPALPETIDGGVGKPVVKTQNDTNDAPRSGASNTAQADKTQPDSDDDPFDNMPV